MRGLFFVAVYLCAACSSANPVSPTPVAPNIAGQWRGTQTITSCVETGAAVGSGFCANLGSGGAMTFTPTQSDSNVNGTLSVGSISLNVSGTIDPAGVLVLAGSGVVPNATVNLTAWRTVVTGSTMTGPLAYSVLGGSPLGEARVSATASLTR